MSMVLNVNVVRSVRKVSELYAKTYKHTYLFKHITLFENVQTVRDTRSNLLRIHFAKTTFGKRNFRYFAIKLYYALSVAIRQNANYSKFKLDTKSLITSQNRSNIEYYFKPDLLPLVRCWLAFIFILCYKLRLYYKVDKHFTLIFLYKLITL